MKKGFASPFLLYCICSDTGCPKKHWNSVTNSISSLLWISIVIPNFKRNNIIMSARVYFMKTVKTVKMWSCVYNVSQQWTVKTDKFTLFVYCNFLVLISTPLCSQNINKQIVNIADGTLTDYSFLIRYHYTKSKNYLKRRYRISLNSHVYWDTLYLQGNNFKFQSQVACGDQIVFSCQTDDICFSLDIKHYCLM